MAVTSLENLKKLSKGQEVELVGWDQDPFVCILKRPSLLGLVANGDIPNPLLTAAHILFHGQTSPKDVVSMKDRDEILRLIAKAAMVEPSYSELEEIGLELTDLQLTEIYNFTQLGIESLITFRTKQENTKNTKNKSKV